jgi:diaminopimelate decarboxylase
MFRYKNDLLYCDDVNIKTIAGKIGTPFYLYSRKQIESNYKKLDASLGCIPHMLCYSCKANSNIAICRALKKLGAGIDILSAGELYKALKAGINPKKIVFAGVGKSGEEIRYALRSNILMFNVESIPELKLINEIAGSMRRTAPIALRVNFGFDPHAGFDYINTSKGSKFGIEISAAQGAFAYARALRNVGIIGMHSHIGSQITEVGPFRKNLELSLSLAEEMKKLNIYIKYIDLGGGFGIGYKEKEQPISVDSLGRAFRLLLSKNKYTLILEPGRFIVGNTGILVTRVLRAKKSFGKTFVIVDAGMNDLIRPSLYGAYHRIITVNKSTRGQVNKVDIVGPVCETGDFLALNRRMRLPEEGGLLAVMDAGAYGFEMASNYNSRLRPAQIMVSGKKFSVIRKRETYEDIVRGEE